MVTLLSCHRLEGDHLKAITPCPRICPTAPSCRGVSPWLRHRHPRASPQNESQAEKTDTEQRDRAGLGYGGRCARPEPDLLHIARRIEQSHLEVRGERDRIEVLTGDGEEVIAVWIQSKGICGG